MKHNC